MNYNIDTLLNVTAQHYIVSEELQRAQPDPETHISSVCEMCLSSVQFLPDCVQQKSGKRREDRSTGLAVRWTQDRD